MLETVIVILILLWILGVLGHIGGALIHAILVIAVVVAIYRLITGRKA